MPNLTIKILDTDKQIVGYILNAIVDELNPRLRVLSGNIASLIQDEIAEYFFQTPTYQSLMNGELAAEFGFERGKSPSIVNPIVKAVAKAIYVTYQPLRVTNTGNIQGGLKINILNADLREILTLYEVNYYASDGNIIPWVEWLLLEGDNFIISDYTFVPNNKGRSSMGIMMKQFGNMWKVPAAYSGTIKNNWLTRTLNDFGAAITDYIGSVIEKEL